MSDLDRARQLLEQGDFTCVLCRVEAQRVSHKRGVAPMLEFLDAGEDLRGFSAADKVVGKALAFLFVLAGVTQVYSPVMSEKAVEVLDHYGILHHSGRLVPYIINRTQTGMCPMEQTVWDMDNPQAACDAIRRRLAQLTGAS